MTLIWNKIGKRSQNKCTIQQQNTIKSDIPFSASCRQDQLSILKYSTTIYERIVMIKGKPEKVK